MLFGEKIQNFRRNFLFLGAQNKDAGEPYFFPF